MLQEFAEQVEKTAKAVVRDIHTALPGKIVSFAPETCTASVRPSGKFVTADGAALEYPLITDVPMTYPFSEGADAGTVFPIKSGDSCLIIVSEVELDQWRTGAESDAPLRFDLTSAMAVPALMSAGRAAIRKAVEENAVVVKAQGAEIVVSDGEVSIVADVAIRGNVTVNGDLTTSGGVVRLN